MGEARAPRRGATANSRAPSTSTVQSVSQVTVAVRGPWSSSDSSPTATPGPMRGDLPAVARHGGLAFDEHEHLAADVALACRARGLPSPSPRRTPGHALELLARRARRTSRSSRGGRGTLSRPPCEGSSPLAQQRPHRPGAGTYTARTVHGERNSRVTTASLPFARRGRRPRALAHRERPLVSGLAAAGVPRLAAGRGRRAAARGRRRARGLDPGARRRGRPARPGRCARPALAGPSSGGARARRRRRAPLRRGVGPAAPGRGAPHRRPARAVRRRRQPRRARPGRLARGLAGPQRPRRARAPAAPPPRPAGARHPHRPRPWLPARGGRRRPSPTVEARRRRRQAVPPRRGRSVPRWTPVPAERRSPRPRGSVARAATPRPTAARST